jgi:MFS transporter, PPP family, 3-phenylpropionic acid transporter
VQPQPRTKQEPNWDSQAARMTIVMSAFFSVTGVLMVFLSRWLEVERGMTGAQIGIIFALPQFARIIVGPAIAFWADAAPDHNRALRFVVLAALLAYAAFFFIGDGFWPLVVLGFVALSLSQSINPLVEAAIVRATDRSKISYGLGRGIASVTFIVANVAGGFLVARFGLGAVVVWILGSLIALTATSWIGLHPDPRDFSEGRKTLRQRLSGVNELIRTPGFLLLISAAGLIQCSHSYYYSFSTMVWRAQGLSAEIIGMLWAVGVLAEVVLFFLLRRIERITPLKALIVIGAAGAVVRWLGTGFAPMGVELWLLQLLHALTFAATHGATIRIISRTTPAHSAFMAQTLNVALSLGILMGTTTLLSGWMYDHIGAKGYWAMAALAFAGGALALFIPPPPPPQPVATLR